MASRKDSKGRALRKGESYKQKRGLYSYTYLDPIGKKRYIYSKTLIGLREKEEKIIVDQAKGVDSYIAGNVDLNYMFDKYMSSRNDLRASTRSNYYEVYDRYVRKDFGKKKLNSIKYSDIVYLYNYLLNEENLHYGTIQYLQRIIRPSLQIAVRDEIISTNPADGTLRNIKKENKLDTYYVRDALSIEQQRAFLNYVDNHSLYFKWKPLFTIMFGTGMRVGEVVGLRWSDIDLEKREINVNHSMFYFAGRRNISPSKWVINEPKTKAGYRIIPMVDLVYEAFVEEKKRQELMREKCLTIVDGMEGFIFYNRFFEIYNPESINRNLARIIENYNSTEEVKAAREKREPLMLPHFTCHCMRHTFCARLCEADTNIKVIQTVMGHKDIQTTLDIYASVTEEKKKASINDICSNMKLF